MMKPLLILQIISNILKKGNLNQLDEVPFFINFNQKNFMNLK